MCNSTNIFIEAARTWNELTDYNYILTYGYKNKLKDITITFSKSDFPHLAGFQYLKDINIPKFLPKQIVQKILDGKLKYSSIIKSIHFEKMVKPRLEALINL